MTKEVITACENGHNLLILWSAGTGKSHLVKKVADALKWFQSIQIFYVTFCDRRYDPKFLDF
jgi:predicted ATPase with chaperone activity